MKQDNSLTEVGFLVGETVTGFLVGGDVTGAFTRGRIKQRNGKQMYGEDSKFRYLDFHECIDQDKVHSLKSWAYL